MTECWECHYNLGGLHCAIHKAVNINNEYCKDYKEKRICLYLKKVGGNND